MRFIDVVEDKSAARDLLAQGGIRSAPPPVARARSPDWLDG
jgi:hypothetical protein